MSEKIKCTKQKIYYNVSIPHNDLISKNGSPTPCEFSEARDEPLFRGRPCDWLMSVIRFTIPTSYIPIQYFPVQEDTTTTSNVNKSIYSITLSYNGVDYQEFLEWETQDDGVPIPPPPSGVTERDFQFNPSYLEYYSLYSLDHFCYLINKAIEKCFTTKILPLLPALPVVVPPEIQKVYKAPYIAYNGSSRLFTIYTQNTFLDTTVNNIELWMNTYLNENFDTSFDTVFRDYSEPLGKNVRYVLLDRGIESKIVDETAPDGFIYKQQQAFDSTGLMQSFTSIIIRSASLPINNEAISIQPRAGQRSGSGIGSGSESIISDFEIDLASNQNLKSFVHYNPTAEYRRINLKGETPITRIDISVFWKDNYDNLYPVLVPAHQIATVKILFEQIN
jgi:hypothetical protein